MQNARLKTEGISMDIKTQLLSEIDGLISHYEGEKISLSHVTHGTLKKSYKIHWCHNRT